MTNTKHEIRETEYQTPPQQTIGGSSTSTMACSTRTRKKIWSGWQSWARNICSPIPRKSRLFRLIAIVNLMMLRRRRTQSRLLNVISAGEQSALRFRGSALIFSLVFAVSYFQFFSFPVSYFQFFSFAVFNFQFFSFCFFIFSFSFYSIIAHLDNNSILNFSEHPKPKTF